MRCLPSTPPACSARLVPRIWTFCAMCANSGNGDGRKLHGYRCRIKFPVYSSAVVMRFDLPAGAA
ncbi:MAG TPA: hypothetical protein VGM03_02060 [Phycisphaerae bacterium]|jgi:hypothetical protein